MEQNLPLAILLMIVSTVLFALAATVQHTVVGEQSEAGDHDKSLSSSQLWALVRSPRWWLGTGFNGVGAAISIVALLLAPVTVVQPLAILAVPWTVLLASRIHGHKLPGRLWAAVGLAVAGTLLFAVVAVQHAVEEDVFDDTFLIVGSLIGFALSGVLALLGARGPQAWRCFAWASASAVIFGLEAGLMKAAGELLSQGGSLGSPTFWAIAVMGVLGSLAATAFMQQGYANGPAETVVGVMNAVGPIAAVLFGFAVLGEGAAMTPTAVVMMVVAAGLAVLGVVLLSRFHPSSATSVVAGDAVAS